MLVGCSHRPADVQHKLELGTILNSDLVDLVEDLVLDCLISGGSDLGA